jgi:hypothetical protein
VNDSTVSKFLSMISHLLENFPRILAECAVAERLRRMPGVELHSTLFNTPLIYGPGAAREAMAAIYREYLAIARNSGLPILLTAPTWRLDASRLAVPNGGLGKNIGALIWTDLPLVSARFRLAGQVTSETSLAMVNSIPPQLLGLSGFIMASVAFFIKIRP